MDIRIPLFFTFLFVLVGCIPITQEKNETPAPVKKPVSQQSAPNIPSQSAQANADSVVDCEDSDGSNPETAGSLKLTYGNGQHESLDDYCPEKSEAAFAGFVVEYTCDGLNPKTTIAKCKGNETCYRGGCIE